MSIPRKTFPIIAGILLLIVFLGIRDIGQYNNKIWLHRCNSLEKLYEKAAKYPNIEVDIVIRDNHLFDVTHDIDTTFNLKIASYFDYMQEKDGRMWMDIKNLTSENKLSVLSRLNMLINHFEIEKERLIIESSNWEALAAFTEDEYYTSYYVPFDEPDELDDEEIDSCINELQKIADSRAVRALSFPEDWYGEIKDKLDRPIDLLTWRHRDSQLEVLLTPSGRRMLNDPQLKVILVKDKGDYHR